MKIIALALLIVAPSLAAADPVPDDTSVGLGLGVSNQQLVGVGGIGIGLLQQPVVGSLRVRFASGLSIEPSVAVSRSVSEMEGWEDSSATTLQLGAAVRYRVARRDRVELPGVGRFGMSRSESATGATESGYTTADLSWGLALDYWLQRHWALSVSATNPLVSHLRLDESGSSTSYGLVLDPRVAVMVHLFY